MTTPDFLLKCFELDCISMVSQQHIPITLCLGGRSRTVLRKQETAFGMRHCRNCLHMYLRNLILSSVCFVFGFLPYLHGSKKFLEHPSRVWAFLFSWWGQATVIAHDLCLRITWDEGWILKRTWPLGTNWTSEECTHHCQDEASKTAAILWTKVFSCPFELSEVFMPNTTVCSMNSQYNSRPTGCSSYCQHGHPFYACLTKVSL